MTQQALKMGEQAWPAGAPGFVPIRQDLATYANHLFVPREAEAQARAALLLAVTRSANERALIEQNLAVALAAQGHGAEADALFSSFVPTLIAGTDRTVAAQAMLAWADADYNAGRSTSGLQRTEQAAALARDGSVRAASRAAILMRLADAYRRVLKFAEADFAANEADRTFRDAGSQSPPPRLNLIRAAILYERGSLSKSLEALNELVGVDRRADPCDPTLTADIAHRRAVVHIARRELPEATADLVAAIAALTPLRLENNPRETEITYALALTTALQREFDRSDRLFVRAADGFRAVYGRETDAEAQALLERGLMLGNAGRPSAGLIPAKRALAILESGIQQGPLSLAYAHAALGLISQQAHDVPTADRELKLALAAFEAARGADSFDLVPGLQALGDIALGRRDEAQAERLLRRALTIETKWGGDSAISLGRTLSQLAAARELAGDHKDALAQSDRSVGVLRRRIALGEALPWNDARTERLAARSILTQDLALTTGSAAVGVAQREPVVVARAFEAVQLANAASTGSAIAQMATRLGQRDPAVGSLLAERNDLTNDWRSILDALSGGLAGEHIAAEDNRRDALLARQRAIAARLPAIDAALALADPNLDLLIRSRTVDVPAMRRVLRAKEAALLFGLGPRESYAVLVTPDGAATWRIALGADGVAALVNRMRAALDPARWNGKQLPAYDVAAAYDLFDALISPGLPALTGTDTILLVPDGALASLPLSVLLTARAAPVTQEARYAELPWLARRFATASYPSAASLVALRGVSRSKAGQNTFLGIGAPVFAGGAPGSVTRGALLRGLATRQIADVGQLRRLEPLPETRQELETIAIALGRGSSRLLFGGDATERAIRTMPLDGYRVIAFATHGLVAGELEGYAEPSLALTPPATASFADDGLLAASEVASLKLNADWVILSACNTAASDGSPTAEPLSGLAKSFFYAGARSLLVTQWAVDSEAGAILTAATVRRAFSDLTPAEALRATAIDFLDNRDKSGRTHPFFWAPYVLIGG